MFSLLAHEKYYDFTFLCSMTTILAVLWHTTGLKMACQLQ